ncbi:glycosyltransferase, partial [Fulvivirga lutimaris]|uniref:glycosyltransferase n=1 Tax=Fulvivirga lutimaris TaxID=1819566 RepID=UPI0012BBF994
NYIIEEIVTNKIESKVRIIISDNHSEDDTQKILKEIISQNEQIQIINNRNDQNIGLEANMVKLLSLAETEYILWVGDDDFIAKGYIQFCIGQIDQNPELGCIITGITKLFEDGSRVHIRNPGFEWQTFKAGYDTALKYSYLGHQLSGLVFKRDGLLDHYLSYEGYRNIYPFVFFITDRMTKYQTLFVPKYRTIVPVFNRKFWDYNDLGLLDEVFKSYYPFLKLFGKKKVGKLIVQFLRQQSSFRLDIRFFRPIKLVKQFIQIVRTLKFTHTGTNIGIFVVLLKEYLLSSKNIFR